MKYVRLPNGSKLECYDCLITGSTCLIKFTDTALDTVKEFLGNEIIDYIDLLNEDGDLTRTCNIYAKCRQLLVEETTVPKTEYRVVREAYTELIPAFTDAASGELIQPARYIEHPDETEPVIRQIPVSMVTAVLEKPGIKEELENLKQAVGIANTNQMTLDEFKDYYIKKSKESLDLYLTTHPLVSDCHNDTEHIYSITKEKQSLMTAKYITYLSEQKLHPESAVITWNASGCICDEWEENEFLQLITEVDAIVRPLVVSQQLLETRIRGCSSMEQIKHISLDYSAYDVRNKTVSQSAESQICKYL